MREKLVMSSLFFALLISFGSLVYGADLHETHGSHEPKMEAHKHHNEQEGKDHHATSQWAKSLSKEQKTAVNDMHNKLDDILKPLKADESLKQKELNNLTIMGNASLSEINNKIDELMSIKNDILRHRYAHLVEMRVILNTEQRVSYDEEILKRDKIK